jgi:hypothetical protein
LNDPSLDSDASDHYHHPEEGKTFNENAITDTRATAFFVSAAVVPRFPVCVAVLIEYCWL